MELANVVAVVEGEVPDDEVLHGGGKLKKCLDLLDDPKFQTDFCDYFFGIYIIPYNFLTQLLNITHS